MNLTTVLNFLFVLCFIQIINAAFTLLEIEKAKDLKKTISTKTNLLVLYASSTKNADVVTVKNLLKQVDGSFAIVDCSNKDLKKLCKKSLPEGKTYVLKHFKDGAFNKDYDRSLTKNSLSTFMRDPTGDIPFEEDPTSKDVLHLFDMSVSFFFTDIICLSQLHNLFRKTIPFVFPCSFASVSLMFFSRFLHSNLRNSCAKRKTF